MWNRSEISVSYYHDQSVPHGPVGRGEMLRACRAPTVAVVAAVAVAGCLPVPAALRPAAAAGAARDAARAHPPSLADSAAAAGWAGGARGSGRVLGLDDAVDAGDEFIEKKRKSLKRLRKAKRLAGDNGPKPEILDETGLNFGDGRGRNFAKRDWPGLDVSAMAAVVATDAPPESPRDGSQASKSPRDKSPRSNQGSPRSQASNDNDNDDQADTWAALLEAMSMPQTASVTTAHRVFVKARDQSFGDYLDYYKDSMSNVLHHYGAIMEEEVQWRTKWEHLVKGLVIESD